MQKYSEVGIRIFAYYSYHKSSCYLWFILARYSRLDHELAYKGQCDPIQPGMTLRAVWKPSLFLI